MKRITCEICGSSDLTKKDGLFVCDYCGTKYDASEVKKMMMTGEVEIKNAPKIKGYLQLALDQYENGDLKKAETTTEKAIMLDPTVADSWYLKALIHKEIEADQKKYLDMAKDYQSNSVGIVDKKNYKSLLKSTIELTFMNDVVDTSYILYTRGKDLTGIVGPKSHEKFKIEAGSYDFILKTTDGRLLTSVKADVTKKGKVRAYKIYTLLGGTPYVEYKE